MVTGTANPTVAKKATNAATAAPTQCARLLVACVFFGELPILAHIAAPIRANTIPPNTIKGPSESAKVEPISHHGADKKIIQL